MNLSAPSAHAVPPRRYPVAEYGFTKQGEASIMKEIGRTVLCTVRESIFGLMVEDMKAAT